MGVVVFDGEFTSPVSAHKFFHVLFVDAHNLIPKIMPHFVKNIDFLSGDGGPGSVQQVNFADGSPVSHVKDRLDLKDADNLAVNYTSIECPAFGETIDYVSHEVKFEAAPAGGCTYKVKSTYHPKGEAVLDKEELKGAEEKYLGKYKAVEGYLIENP